MYMRFSTYAFSVLYSYSESESWVFLTRFVRLDIADDTSLFVFVVTRIRTKGRLRLADFVRSCSFVDYFHIAHAQSKALIGISGSSFFQWCVVYSAVSQLVLTSGWKLDECGWQSYYLRLYRNSWGHIMLILSKMLWTTILEWAIGEVLDLN